MQDNPDLWSGCISGAWHEPELLNDFEKLGFKNIQLVERSLEPWKIINNIEFRSVTLIGEI